MVDPCCLLFLLFLYFFRYFQENTIHTPHPPQICLYPRFRDLPSITTPISPPRGSKRIDAQAVQILPEIKAQVLWGLCEHKKKTPVNDQG